MSEQVEQITQVPNVTPIREKDPKRVAAGKKLAESNKRMREEHAKYKAEEAQRETQQIHEAPEASEIETNQSSLSDGLLSQLSLTNVISLVGIGLTVYTIFFKKSGDKGEKRVAWQEPVEIVHDGEPKQEVKPKTKPRPKFGM